MVNRFKGDETCGDKTEDAIGIQLRIKRARNEEERRV